MCVVQAFMRSHRVVMQVQPQSPPSFVGSPACLSSILPSWIVYVIMHASNFCIVYTFTDVPNRLRSSRRCSAVSSGAIFKNYFH